MKKMIFIAVVAFLLTAPVYGQMRNQTGGGEVMKNEEAKDGLTQEATEGGVTVKVTYKNPVEWRPVFDVAMDSLYVELDNYKFDEIAVLYDDLGGIYRPSIVSSKGLGRHRRATLKFEEANASSANSFELAIKGVADVGVRVFKFNTRTGLTK